MNQEDLELLVKKYIENSATPEEKLYLQHWYNNTIRNTAVWNLENEDSEDSLKRKILSDIFSKAGLGGESILNEKVSEDKNSRNIHLRKKWMKYAAISICIIGLSSAYYFLSGHIYSSGITLADNNKEITGGKKEAILTLSDGRQIFLERQKKGPITEDILKSDDSTLSYVDKTKADGGLNILTTPRGCQYSVILPDNTRVWLNAGTSLKYASSFTGKERIVYLSGEAYFKVKHDPDHPFHVIAGNNTIEDIGTAFNINAYSDEAEIKATLIQGAIKVGNSTLRPGQQAVINDGRIKIISVDTSEAMGWMNGYFIFNNTDIKDAMRQISRWYNVEIEYKGTIPDIKFGGGISRSNAADDVLSILAQNNIHFKIENHKITVMP